MPRGKRPTGNPPGRPKGLKNKATIEREIEAARAQAIIEGARGSGRKLAKEVLDEFMQLFAGMAATYQPLPPGVEAPPGRKPDPGEFEKYARLAVQCARDLAPFQSPRFQAIVVAPPPPDMGQQNQSFTLTIFESGPKPKLIDVPAANGRGDDDA